MYYKENNQNKIIKAKRHIKSLFLLVLVAMFSFPHIGIGASQTLISQDVINPEPRAKLSNYYDGPTLPEIAKREARRTMYIPVTSYNSEPGQTDDTPFITASGTRTRDGVVAANFLPIGTVVRFPEIFGDKEFIVEDRMNKRYYYKADIWMADKQESIKFGVKYTKIEIL